jgi:hypothetical protein
MERVNIKQVLPNPDNPRIIKGNKFDKLVASIKEFPEMLELRPIVVNKDMVVLGGNMRLKACEEAGLAEVPVVFADNLTPEQEREFIIKDNSNFGEWDWDLLANQWDTQLLNDWGLELWVPEEDVSNNTDYSINSLDKKLDRFLDAKIKNITIPFEAAEFDEVVLRLETLLQKYECEDYRELLYKVLENENL